MSTVTSQFVRSSTNTSWTGSTWINPLAKLVFTWVYWKTESSHPYASHHSSCRHIVPGDSPGVTTPRPPNSNPLRRMDDKRSRTALALDRYMRNIESVYIWQMPIYSVDSRVYIQQKSIKFMCPRFALTGTILQWHAELIGFLLKNLPENTCTSFTSHNLKIL